MINHHIELSPSPNLLYSNIVICRMIDAHLCVGFTVCLFPDSFTCLSGAGVTSVEKAEFANMRPSVYVQQYPVARFSLTIFYGALKKITQFAISTICQHCLHTKQHTHLCSAAAPLQSHSERERADAVSTQQQRAAACVCPRISINTTFLH